MQQTDDKGRDMRTSDGWLRSVSMLPPSLEDNTADAERLVGALKKELGAEAVEVDLSLLKHLPRILRRVRYSVDCLLFKERKRWTVLDALDPLYPKPVVGLAVDLGTTRVVLRLVNLKTGAVLGESAFDNPQISVGPDILARIHFADTPGGLEKLNGLIIGALNENTATLCHSVGIQPADIRLISLAGNTAMTHLFMGLDPHWMIREPYIPVVNRPGVLKAAELGISVNPSARVLIFPNIGSYFGGDLIAGILFSGLNTDEETAILVDVGTNAEVVLGNRNWLIACAGAAGPALEGGVTRMGMMAGPGVIDQVAIDPQTLEFNVHTIGDVPAKGICGSGLIDLAAQLFLAGMLDLRGKLIPEVCGSRLTEKNGIANLVVVSGNDSADRQDLSISQADLDSLIRSKAAMYTILETITSSVGMTLEALSIFYVAGTFGSFIKPESAITVGMLPDLPLSSYKPLGNSSLGGATLALTSSTCIDEIDAVRDRITYMELNVNQEFMNRFSAAKFLPHTDPARFPSVKVGKRR
jgi:uncharacterized 2Fe-2S/4Fe-4S cluster protein (DUF4445 family)